MLALRAADEVAEEWSVHSLTALVGGDPREVEQRAHVRIVQFEGAGREAGHFGECVTCRRQPCVHRSILERHNLGARVTHTPG
jgi:hypothetical protein